MWIDEKVFPQRPSGAAVNVSDQIVVKITRDALEEGQALRFCLEDYPQQIRPVEVHASLPGVLITQRLVQYGEAFDETHLKLHLLGLHQLSKMDSFQPCTEEQYRNYCSWPRGALHNEFLPILEALSGLVRELAADNLSSGKCRVHGDASLWNSIRIEHDQLRWIDMSTRPSIPLPGLDLAKTLFSVLGDAPVGSPEKVKLVESSMKAREVSDREMIYFLASHVLRVSRKEAISSSHLRRIREWVYSRLGALPAANNVCVMVPYSEELLANNFLWERRENVLIVSDLDGTLVLSKEATINAYREAGYEFSPGDWGKSAADIGIPPEVHAKKIRIWPRYAAKDVNLSRFGDLVKSSLTHYNKELWPIVLTGATAETATATLNQFGLDALHSIMGVNSEEKVQALLQMLKAQMIKARVKGSLLWKTGIVYFDDNKEFLSRMRLAYASECIVNDLPPLLLVECNFETEGDTK